MIRPWRWEYNAKSKIVQICGGPSPRYDLTVMDFERWGMQGARPRLREDVAEHNIMHPCGKWSKGVPGRLHHEEWFRTINHPDANLIAQAPAFKLALDLIAAGKARLEPLSGGTLEFCFNGLRYVVDNGDYSKVFDCIGWGRARQILSAETTPLRESAVPA